MADKDIDILFEPGSESTLAAYLQLLHSADIAELFDHVSEENWPKITRQLSAERLAEVLADLDEEQLESEAKGFNGFWFGDYETAKKAVQSYPTPSPIEALVMSPLDEEKFEPDCTTNLGHMPPLPTLWRRSRIAASLC